jgi:long-chain acyl-CoA synthetase
MNPEIAHPPFAEAQPAQRNKLAAAAEAARRIEEGNRTKAAAMLGPSTLNLGGLLPRHARYRGSHPALVVGGRTLTFRELNVYVNRLANALLAAGLKKGDKFATILPNCLELMASYWAAAKTGLVIVPVSPLLLATGLQTLLRDSDTRLVIGDPAFAESWADIRGELPAIETAVLVGDAPGVGMIPFHRFAAEASGGEPPDVHLTGDDVFNIMYSSGTTGLPKGIVHTHFVRSMYCTLFAHAWRMTPESVVLHAGSIVFNGCMLDLMPWMFIGGTYILHESFKPERVIEDIERWKVTHAVMVPAQIIAILQSPAFEPGKLTSLEMIHNVGAPLHVEHKRILNEVLPGRFYELYGLTEGFVTILDKRDSVRKLGSVGCPSPFFEIRILRPDGSECGTGEVGEICGRGPILMHGYYKQPELTRTAMADGLLHTGDAGYLDEDGYLFLVDRIKDMIISGGVNVYPHDVEEVVIRHPAVRETAVFGAPDEKWGEVPIAAVVAKEGASIDREELIAWTNARVDAKFQRIHDIVIYQEFPRNAAGKTLKREMRTRFAATRLPG